MRRALASIALFAATGCATQPEFGREGEKLPTAALGPFRDLATQELGNDLTTPNVVKDGSLFTRDPAVLDDDGDPTTPAVTGWFAEAPDAFGGTTRIAKRSAADGRSFDYIGETVFEASEIWEGGTVGAPSVLEVEGEIWIYYSARAGIGLFRNGGKELVFPSGDPIARSPSVIVDDDGVFRMFYEVATSLPGDGTVGEGAVIREATSADGVSWEVLGDALLPGEAGEFDDVAVGTPHAVLGTSALGRRALHLYYGAVDSTGAGAIGLASRFVGPDAPEIDPLVLHRAAGPVYGTQKARHARQPWVVFFDPADAAPFALLFATQEASLTSDELAVAGALSPGDAELPPHVP